MFRHKHDTCIVYRVNLTIFKFYLLDVRLYICYTYVYKLDDHFLNVSVCI